MTYCVALRLNHGLVYLSDSRTNAGVDDISTFCKMHAWEVPGERALTLLSAGNLATTQAVVSLLEERNKSADDRDPSILKAASMFEAAQLVGETLREAIADAAARSGMNAGTFGASLIFGGQIAGGGHRLFRIYPEGNFIETDQHTAFFQIGETKYGRPILVRAYDVDMSFEDACKLLMVSMDSTVRANLSVGLPLDLQVYAADSLTIGKRIRIDADDAYYDMISRGWGDALRQAFDALPPFDLENT
jgi:putative proteasome-type protease